MLRGDLFFFDGRVASRRCCVGCVGERERVEFFYAESTWKFVPTPTHARRTMTFVPHSLYRGSRIQVCI